MLHFRWSAAFTRAVYHLLQLPSSSQNVAIIPTQLVRRLNRFYYTSCEPLNAGGQIIGEIKFVDIQIEGDTYARRST